VRTWTNQVGKREGEGTVACSEVGPAPAAVGDRILQERDQVRVIYGVGRAISVFVVAAEHEAPDQEQDQSADKRDHDLAEDAEPDRDV
jgi:hypothetical protein